LDVVREALQDIVSDGKRAGDVITRIRSMVKHTPLRRAPISINVVVDDVIALCRRLLRERHVRLHVALEPELPEVVGDRIQLQQILLNLVLNAADAMHANNGRPRALAIRSTRCDGGVTVSVSDSGAGLNGESLQRVFTPFFTTKLEGMGMGLAISRSIAEAHGGRLNLTHNSPEGATFELELPTAPVSAGSASVAV
jgi:C4-dicarboxylate-specific signal transduction histidine kinase